MIEYKIREWCEIMISARDIDRKKRTSTRKLIKRERMRIKHRRRCSRVEGITKGERMEK